MAPDYLEHHDDEEQLRPSSAEDTNLSVIKGCCHSKVLQSVLLAQLLSVLLALTGIESELLAEQGINAPTFQNFINYCLLAITCSSMLIYQRRPIKQQLHIYALLALMDVEANFLVTKAYQYTFITSVTLLDCFTIPAVMLLSYLFLKARYSAAQYFGAALCITGLAVMVLSDHNSAAEGGISHKPLLGDTLVILGAALYAICNVTQEKILGEVDMMEMLAFIGIFGSIISGVQVLALERQALASFKLSTSSVQPFLGFAFSLYLFYLLVPKVLVWGGATVLNLSLLTSDLWSAVARVVFFGGFGSTLWAFLLSLLLVAAGLSIYTLAGPVKGAGSDADSCAGADVLYQHVPATPESELSCRQSLRLSQESSASA